MLVCFGHKCSAAAIAKGGCQLTKKVNYGHRRNAFRNGNVSAVQNTSIPSHQPRCTASPMRALCRGTSLRLPGEACQAFRGRALPKHDCWGRPVQHHSALQDAGHQGTQELEACHCEASRRSQPVGNPPTRRREEENAPLPLEKATRGSGGTRAGPPFCSSRGSNCAQRSRSSASGGHCRGTSGPRQAAPCRSRMAMHPPLLRATRSA